MGSMAEKGMGMEVKWRDHLEGSGVFLASLEVVEALIWTMGSSALCDSGMASDQ